ncbi:MAG: DUF1727 domain-containing protein [Firmicutes bacterium]|nr:DUF1727 domain-containing protein [Bacillota bacterium]
MNIRLILTIIISKIAVKFCRLIRRGGTSLPGGIALTIYPDVLKEISKTFKIIAVTGTNGKTTTTRVIGQILKENGIGYITNKSGANLLNGITTSFIEAVDLKGRSFIPTALLEIDEAAFNKVMEHSEPYITIVTNFFRDQLDRYGEVYTTLNSVLSGIRKTPGSILILNADDSLCASLGRESSNRAVYYGFSSTAWSNTENTVNSDAMFCLYCKTRYNYENHIYGHLGGFICPQCGYRRPESTITCLEVTELTSSYTRIKLDINGTTADAKINLPGIYNIYNCLAGAACGAVLRLPCDNILRALSTFECGFGRMEAIITEGKSIKVILVKNPTGFNQVLDYILTEDKKMQIAFLINDRAADGRDISWLWDVDFEKLEKIYDKIITAYVSGIRGPDMAVRLKYAGFNPEKIKIMNNYSQLIDNGLAGTPEGSTFYILPTYTAMLDIRDMLKKNFKLKEFWE